MDLKHFGTDVFWLKGVTVLGFEVGCWGCATLGIDLLFKQAVPVGQPCSHWTSHFGIATHRIHQSSICCQRDPLLSTRQKPILVMSFCVLQHPLSSISFHQCFTNHSPTINIHQTYIIKCCIVVIIFTKHFTIDSLDIKSPSKAQPQRDAGSDGASISNNDAGAFCNFCSNFYWPQNGT